MMILISFLAMMSQAGADKAAEPRCGLNSTANTLASLIISHPAQKRDQLQCNETLTQLADQRARDLLNGTADDAITPNQVLVEGGYRFASYYPPTGNQVEAVAKNKQNPEAAMQYFTQGNKHHDHVLGFGEFFARQNELGVGYHENEFGQSQYVVFIAEPYASPKIVFKQTFQPPRVVTKAKCPKNWRHSNDEQVRKVCKAQQQKQSNNPD